MSTDPDKWSNLLSGTPFETTIINHNIPHLLPTARKIQIPRKPVYLQLAKTNHDQLHFVHSRYKIEFKFNKELPPECNIAVRPVDVYYFLQKRLHPQTVTAHNLNPMFTHHSCYTDDHGRCFPYQRN